MKITEKILEIELEEFLERHDLTEKAFEKTGLKVSELNEIANHHASKREQLTRVSNYVANTLQQITEVHSVKARLKSPESLVAKLIRKRIDKPDRVIGVDNYEAEITDLIGVRALHLFKGDWKPISEFTKKEWEAVEQPVAYHRSGDAEEIIKAFTASGLRTEVRAVGYRSVHHVIRCSPSRVSHPVEIQIRTVFEEAWAEIDHIVRYPRKTDNPELAGFLKLFNSFAGTADDMGTYLMSLRQWLIDHKESVERERKRAEKLEAQVAKLKISDRERQELQKEIAAIRTAPSTLSPPVFVSTSSSPGMTFSVPGGMLDAKSLVFGTNTGSIDPSLGFGNYGSSQTIKTCPNGHIFVASGLQMGASICPECGAHIY